jgi:hypothetical protein
MRFQMTDTNTHEIREAAPYERWEHRTWGRLTVGNLGKAALLLLILGILFALLFSKLYISYDASPL